VVGLGASRLKYNILAARGEEAGVYTSCNSSEQQTYVAGYCQGVTRDGCYQPQSTFAVAPGDGIFASVFYDRFTHKYTYEVHDLDTGQKLTVTRSCASGCSINSAAVTADDPSGGPYSTFSEVQFASVRVTDTAGARGGLLSSAWRTLAQNAGCCPDEFAPAYGPLYSSTSPAESAFQLYYSKPG
jgi:hypothetical protein